MSTTTEPETYKWCSQFKKCKGCKLDSECAVGPMDKHPYIKDGVIIDPWAIRTTEMIRRELAAK
ncbi:antirestriction Ral family protein [Leclercia sp.]|uniref:antirestriction Ral family protein n=1 Tax=Leclercia sp. TaxID=1898428 RepID=UPI0028AB655C|nr:antirestriction Ral family protein [Leclercia sp.]